MIVLAVHIDQVLGHLLEHAERDRIAVEADARSPAGVEPAREQQLAAVGGDGDIGELLDLASGASVFADLEDAADAALVRAGAEHLRGAAQAEQHLDRADDQALARAGRAGEAVQPRCSSMRASAITARLEMWSSRSMRDSPRLKCR